MWNRQLELVVGVFNTMISVSEIILQFYYKWTKLIEMIVITKQGTKVRYVSSVSSRDFVVMWVNRM